MFLFDETDFMIFSCIRDIWLVPGIRVHVGIAPDSCGSYIILRHCGHGRVCICSSGAADAIVGGRRRRLIELKIKDFNRFPLFFIGFD